jgi:hypothetical protein
MKIVLGAALLAATCLVYTNAEGQSKEKPEAAIADAWGWGHKVKPTEIDFTLEFINSGITQLAGVNRHREITGNIIEGSRWRAALVNKQSNMVVFDCLQFNRPDETNTYPAAINNDGTILSGCDSGTFGYIRRKGGSGYQFSVPGADGTTPFAINDKEDVVGEHYNPFTPTMNSGWYRFHSFLRKADGQITIISAPPHPDDIGAPNSLTRTVAYGINNRMQIIGTSETIFTPNNTAGLWSGFVYDNGQFTDLPEQHAWPIAINNDATILAQRPTGQYVLYDDGKAFTIAIPEPYKWAQIKGLTDKGELFGVVVDISVSPRKFFNVIATPK